MRLPTRTHSSLTPSPISIKQTNSRSCQPFLHSSLSLGRSVLMVVYSNLRPWTPIQGRRQTRGGSWVPVRILGSEIRPSGSRSVVSYHKGLDRTKENNLPLMSGKTEGKPPNRLTPNNFFLFEGHLRRSPDNERETWTMNYTNKRVKRRLPYIGSWPSPCVGMREVRFVWLSPFQFTLGTQTRLSKERRNKVHKQVSQLVGDSHSVLRPVSPLFSSSPHFKVGPWDRCSTHSN